MTVRIANPVDWKRYRDVDFLVDSGAIYTVVPKKILEELGIKPHSKRSFLLANGEKFERFMGSADILYEKRHGAATVVRHQGAIPKRFPLHLSCCADFMSRQGLRAICGADYGRTESPAKNQMEES